MTAAQAVSAHQVKWRFTHLSPSKKLLLGRAQSPGSSPDTPGRAGLGAAGEGCVPGAEGWELEHCQLQPGSTGGERGGWVCVCSCSIGQEMLMGNRINSNCLVVGETLTTLWLGACSSPASETTAGEIMVSFPFFFSLGH